ncbi:MAG: hypothetical protein K1W17_02860 [Oscillospiraceae bacterium]|mgnify:FL=1
MRFIDAFPYEAKDYFQLISYFEKSVDRNFGEILSTYADGHQYRFSSCGLNLPKGHDNLMRKGPFAWAGNPSVNMAPNEFDQLDFKMFIICFELAARVYLFNEKICNDKMTIFSELKKIRERYTDVLWIIEHFYGVDDYVCDDQGIYTGEHHTEEWGREWYEKYGKHLNFEDIDDIVNTAWNNALKNTEKTLDF